jgi:hypothetical protein
VRKGLRKNKINGSDHHLWKGGKTTNSYGYVKSMCPGHPRADRDGYVFEHILIAEKAFGGHLPEKVEVHHFDEKKSNNSNRNLVICEDHSYHRLLHCRTKSMQATGKPNLRYCSDCGEWKEYKDFGASGNWLKTHCKDCRRNQYRANLIAAGKPLDVHRYLTEQEISTIKDKYIPGKFGTKRIGKTTR